MTVCNKEHLEYFGHRSLMKDASNTLDSIFDARHPEYFGQRSDVGPIEQLNPTATLTATSNLRAFTGHFSIQTHCKWYYLSSFRHSVPVHPNFGMWSKDVGPSGLQFWLLKGYKVKLYTTLFRRFRLRNFLARVGWDQILTTCRGTSIDIASLTRSSDLGKG